MQHTHDRVANLLGVLALAVADQMACAMTEAAAQGGGAPAALVQIADHPGLTIEELRRRVGLSHSTVVRLLDRLAARGLVRRDRNRQDARTAGLRLTGQGQALARSVLAARRGNRRDHHPADAGPPARPGVAARRNAGGHTGDVRARQPAVPGVLPARVPGRPVPGRASLPGTAKSSLATSCGLQDASRWRDLRPGRRRGRCWRRRGYAGQLGWLAGFGIVALAGIEGTGSRRLRRRLHRYRHSRDRRRGAHSSRQPRHGDPGLRLCHDRHLPRRAHPRCSPNSARRRRTPVTPVG